MIPDDDMEPCWSGDIDITRLKNLLGNCEWSAGATEGTIREVEFVPLSVRDVSPPFSPGVIPAAVAVVDLCQVPLWMFADMSWNISTSAGNSNKFFESLLQSSPLLPNNTFAYALLLTTPEANILIITTLDSTTSLSSLHAKSLHPPTLLTPSLRIKHESPGPSSLANPFLATPSDREGSPNPPFAGQFLAVVSPARISAREASCSQFSAKLESPHRRDNKARQERRVQSLLHADITRRRKQESLFLKREGSVISGKSRESSVMREASMAPSSTSGSSTGVAVALEAQTKEVVKQTVVAALRLQSISPTDADYKGLIGQCVNGAMFALREKLRAGKSVGIAEIGSVVEGLLDIFIAK